jgi:hypothetical protein
MKRVYALFYHSADRACSGFLRGLCGNISRRLGEDGVQYLVELLAPKVRRNGSPPREWRDRSRIGIQVP